MRYRPFGASGLALSSIGLAVGEEAATAHGVELIYAALEAGVNVFQVTAGDEHAVAAVAEALSHVDRRLLFVVLRAGVHRDRQGELTRDFSPAALVTSVRTVGSALKLGPLDLILLDDPAAAELSPRALEAVYAERDGGRVKGVGVSGDSDAMDAYISAKAFDVLATPYNLFSGWKERNRLKTAAAQEMPVLGYRFMPPELDLRERQVAAAAAPAARSGLFRRHPTASEPRQALDRTPYAFLEEIRGWSPQEICLAFTLTEPGLSSTLIAPRSLEEVEALTAVPDRDMPTYIAAQIEMARFTAQPLAG